MISETFKNIICFSHLRWDFVFQRPQHLLTRFSKNHFVFYWEEPVFDSNQPVLIKIEKSPSLQIIIPHLPPNLSVNEQNKLLESLLNDFLYSFEMNKTIFWYYTPMAFPFTKNFKPEFIIYDCMDELSAFDFAPTEISLLEKQLLVKSDLVFTGGKSLFEAKKAQHHNIYSFPSSIDRAHFAKAKTIQQDPEDQKTMKHPRIGFFGVIDERFDKQLIQEIAIKRPDFQIILIGPIVKINPDHLPKNENIHYLGAKKYDDLPAYLSHWDVALIPFAINKSTQFISPTKTPEYLSAGIPVISTPIEDIVYPYGKNGLVHIAYNSEDFIKCIELELKIKLHHKTDWLSKVDVFLNLNSWDLTFEKMQKLIQETYDNRILMAS